jgi:MFS family permease
MGGFMILSSTMSKSGSVLNPLSKSLGTPDAWSGLLVAASTIPGILVSLPAASLSDVFGRRRFLLIAGLIFASAPFLYLLITIWWQLILVRFYHGFATAIFVPVAEASIAELFPNNRGQQMSLFTSATYVGRVIAPSLGGYILFATNSDFHQVYLAVAFAALTGLIISLPFLARRRQETPTGSRPTRETMKKMLSSWRKLASNSSTAIVSLVQASQYYVFGAFDFYIAGYMINVLKYTTFGQGLVYSTVLVVAIFARPSMGRVSDRIGRRIPIILGCILSAVALATIPYITDFTTLIVLLVAYGFGFATVTASTSPLMCDIAPNETVGISMGFLNTTMDIGQTIGGFVSGLVFASSLHYAGVFLVFAAVLLFGCAVFAFSGVQTRVVRLVVRNLRRKS